MDASVHIRSFRPIDLTDMFMAFLDAFSDYPVAFKLSKEQFVRKFVEKLKIDFALSLGAYDFDTLAGFVFTSTSHYQGVFTAYNGGTGVRPSFRGNAITQQIYKKLIPLLRERKVQQCVLEVLVNNEKAIHTYETIGFKKTRYFKCFKLKQRPPVASTPKISLEITRVTSPRWTIYDYFVSAEPSFLDTQQMITSNLANEQIVEAIHNGECLGYAIYQPTFGRISQVAVAPEWRRKGIGSNLVYYIYNTSLQKDLTVINVNENDKELISFFDSIGFDNQLNQYEMVLSLQ